MGVGGGGHQSSFGVNTLYQISYGFAGCVVSCRRPSISLCGVDGWWELSGLVVVASWWRIGRGRFGGGVTVWGVGVMAVEWESVQAGSCSFSVCVICDRLSASPRICVWVVVGL